VAITDDKGLDREAAELKKDFADYEVVLKRIVDAVAKGENSSPEFPALISEWARLGGRLVDAAAKLNTTGIQSAEQSFATERAVLGRSVLLTIAGCLLALVVGGVVAGLVT